VVFTNQTLEELSSVRPGTIPELLGINGIGPAKVDRYGDQILAIIEQTQGG
jgi:DNA helicase-2/ATP-dependent DNA helicase PcrA